MYCAGFQWCVFLNSVHGDKSNVRQATVGAGGNHAF